MKRMHTVLSGAAALTLSALLGFSHATDQLAQTDFFEPARAQPCPQTAPKLETTEALGPLYDIDEPDILELFMERLNAMKASGEYERRFNQEKARIASQLERPAAVATLVRASERRTWLLTPSIPETLPAELLLAASEVQTPDLGRELLFIDGEDETQLEAAADLTKRFKDLRIVLINGSPAEVSRALNRRIFFDQGGGLTRTFGIKAVPALLFNSRQGPAGIEFAADDIPTSEELNTLTVKS